MNFLVDANLPPRLGQWLRDRNQPATHLLDLHSLRISDKQLWALAITRSEVIITKDTDFYERSLLLGQPPKVVLIALGNCNNDELLHQLDQSWKNIETELADGARLIMIQP